MTGLAVRKGMNMMIALPPVAGLFASTLTTSIISLGILVAAAFFGWICYAIAKAAGYSGWPFFILGFFTAIVGVAITTIVYFVARHRNTVQRAAQREAAAPIPLGNVDTVEDNPLLTRQFPTQPPQGQQQAYPDVGQQAATASPGPVSPPASASAPCPNCAAPVPVGTSPCPNCGTNLKWPESTPPSTPPSTPTSGQWQ
jgi:hypothetical protein